MPRSAAPAPPEPESLLSPRERAALAYFRASPNMRALDASFNSRLFELWLNGCDCAEIHRLNPALALGQVVAARVSGEWDRRREEHQSRLLDETSDRVKQVQLESVGFVANLMAAANKMHGDSVKAFLQTGDPADLGALRIDSLSAYQKAVDLLMKLTGQDKQVKVLADVTHRVAGAQKPLTATESADSLKRLRGR